MDERKAQRLMNFNYRLAGVSALAITCLVGMPGISYADPITLADLAPGSHYRLVFESITTTDATSSDVSTYNSIVQGDASAAGLGTSWSAIVSTDTTNAIDNIACTPSCSSDPIFLVTGSEVAASTADLFSGAILTAINVAADGSAAGNGYIWTGTNSSGTEASYTSNDTTTFYGLGDSATELGGSVGGSPYGIDSGYAFDSGIEASLFAISGDLVVPAPEPISASLLAVGAAATALTRRRRRTRQTAI